MSLKEVVEVVIGVFCVGVFVSPLVYLFVKFFEMMFYDLTGHGDEWKM